MLSETYFYPTDIHGHTVRLPSHRAIQWLRDPTFERERIRAMAQVIQPDHVVFDIGAEQGDISALLASWVPDGGVVLVEPNPKVWPCIRATFKENGLPKPIAGFVGFCASESGEGWGTQSWPAECAGTIDPAAGFAHLAEQDDIDRASLDDLADLIETHPDVLTIDVEGAELEVLKGAAATLRGARPQVFVSIHPAFIRHHFDQTPGDVMAFMDDAGYRAHYLAADHEIHVWFQPR